MPAIARPRGAGYTALRDVLDRVPAEGPLRRALEAPEIGKPTRSRNVTVLGQRTSIRAEPVLWDILRVIAAEERVSVHDLASLAALARDPEVSLTGTLRGLALAYLLERSGLVAAEAPVPRRGRPGRRAAATAVPASESL